MTERLVSDGDTALPENTLSRRSMLAGIPAAALLPMAAVVPLVIAGSGVDTELFALASAIEAASRKYDAALAAFGDTETAYFKSRPQKPVFDNELYRHLKGDEKRVYFDACGPLIDDYETRDAEIKNSIASKNCEKLMNRLKTRTMNFSVS